MDRQPDLWPLSLFDILLALVAAGFGYLLAASPPVDTVPYVGMVLGAGLSALRVVLGARDTWRLYRRDNARQL
jgi:hypothetical protein